MEKIIVPTPEQAEWADCELGVLIHYDLPVFLKEEYDFRAHYGDPLPASLFDPDDLDVEQWVKSAADMGAKYAVLVAKHCTGFCLWPTALHDYSVKSTPWKNGKGDIVGDFVSCCRKYGLRPGLYYSAACNQYLDVDNPGTVRSGDPAKQKAYNETVIAQLTELWTNYGKLFEIWFDGGCLPPEKGGPDIAGLLHRLQPDAVVFQGPEGTKSLLRWIGNESGIADEDCSAIYRFSDDRQDEDTQKLYIGDTMGDTWCPAESDLPNRDARTSRGGGWFWAENEEHSVKSAEHLFDTYVKSVGRGTNMLVGMVIDSRGRFPEKDAAEFKRFAELRQAAFGTELAGAQGGSPLTAEVPDGKTAKWLELREDITKGENVLGYAVKGLDANGQTVFEKSGRIIGHKRLIPLSGGVTKVECRITKAKCEDVSVSMRLY